MKRRKFVKYLGATSVYIGATSCASAPLFNKGYNEEITKQAWNKIAKKGDAFNYLNPVKKRPNVLLYGDSISIGYTQTVRKELEGKATVFRIYKNGQSSGRFIPNMEKMKKAIFQPYLKEGWNFNWDVIHFNVGLHDLKYVKNGKLDLENGRQVNSIEKYKENLHGICNYLKKEHPKATLIFATTTPIPKEGAEGRLPGDSIKYNKAAREVLIKYPSIIENDLYDFTKPNETSWYVKPHNVHFNDLGKTAQGKQVAKVIAENI